MNILFKTVGSVFVMTAALYFSLANNQMLDSRKQELRRLYSLLLQLKSEIQYMNNPLPEIFMKLSGQAKDPFCTWFLDMADRTDNEKVETFSSIWISGMEHLKAKSSLNKEDIEPLFELGERLGNGDITTQIKAIDYALLHLENNRKALEGEMEQKKKVTLTLSLFFGAMIWIILI